VALGTPVASVTCGTPLASPALARNLLGSSWHVVCFDNLLSSTQLGMQVASQATYVPSQTTSHISLVQLNLAQQML
jgi:hypothetical protein